MQPCIINIVLFKCIKLSTQVNYWNIYPAMHHHSCPFCNYQVKRVSKNTSEYTCSLCAKLEDYALSEMAELYLDANGDYVCRKAVQ